ncbi:hypothetical protein M5C97_17540 [Acidovorax sp. NCPPB 3859]|nr:MULTISPECIES: hypothetical protein [unclassified Acidovorax]MDA8451580.1 hypothetical protein [Acidovorax sp. GBBC 3297]WCM82198.1 hypothetical protein M5C97_17540 [Acidovorax sp. NCPPB 3859]
MGEMLDAPMPSGGLPGEAGGQVNEGTVPVGGTAVIAPSRGRAPMHVIDYMTRLQPFLSP